jgi:hypothetical protein
VVSYPPRNLLLAIPVKSGFIAIATRHLQLLFVQRRISAITLQRYYPIVIAQRIRAFG